MGVSAFEIEAVTRDSVEADAALLDKMKAAEDQLNQETEDSIGHLTIAYDSGKEVRAEDGDYPTTYTFYINKASDQNRSYWNIVFYKAASETYSFHVVEYDFTKKQVDHLMARELPREEVVADYADFDNTPDSKSSSSHQKELHIAPPVEIPGVIFILGKPSGGGGAPGGSLGGVGSSRGSGTLSPVPGNPPAPHGGGGGGGSAPTTPSVPDYKIDLDDSFKDNDCLKGVYEAMGGSETFNEYLKEFDKDMSVADLKFKVDDNFSSNRETKYHSALAVTDPPLKSNQIDITFNVDSSTKGNIIDEPDVFKVVSMMHEVLHADMYRKMLDAIRESNKEAISLKWSTQDEFDDYLESLENKYFGIFDYYTRYNYGVSSNEDPNDYQHQQMADAYRDVIENAVSEYDPNLSEKQKEALGWLGLNDANIKAWQNKKSSEQKEITRTIKDIQNDFKNKCE